MNISNREYASEARAFAKIWLVVSMSTTMALEAANVLPSLLGLTIIVSAGYFAAHYWARRAHGRNISGVGSTHSR